MSPRGSLCAMVVVWLGLTGWGEVRGEIFTALVHMEGLVALEKELLSGLDGYLELERQR